MNRNPDFDVFDAMPEPVRGALADARFNWSAFHMRQAMIQGAVNEWNVRSVVSRLDHGKIATDGLYQ